MPDLIRHQIPHYSKHGFRVKPEMTLHHTTDMFYYYKMSGLPESLFYKKW